MKVYLISTYYFAPLIFRTKELAEKYCDLKYKNDDKQNKYIKSYIEEVEIIEELEEE